MTMRVVHVISDLTQGGAEMVLYRLVAGTPGNAHLVVSLASPGHLGPRLEAAGARVEALGMTRGQVTVSDLRRLRELIRAFAPDVVQTRLHHANLLGGLAARSVGVPVVWALHATWLGPFRTTWKTRAVRLVCGMLSRIVPRAIVFDAERSRAVHARLGYSRRRSVVIDNGVDLESYSPDRAARARVRAEWGVPDEVTLFGCVARWDRLKDHENLLAGFAGSASRHPQARLVLVGREMAWDNAPLVALIDRHGLRERVILAGVHGDMPGVFNALDVHVLASRSESAPMTVIEALACGIPCVVTDVGDAARLVGDAGWVVPPRSPSALAAAMDEVVEAIRGPARDSVLARSRARAVSEFGVTRMVEQYERLWRGEALC